ncbi:MAG TPA: patatin-like phospholipase family protein [Gaiellaceae bacterium]|nr:patatin-like phospholipase family protein [Gaiellaceae bacterium]
MSVPSQIGAQHELLANVPLLSGADEQTLAELAQCLRPVEVRAGDIVIRQGDPADRMYLVRSGRLRVLVDQEDGLRIVRELGAGAAIGELALLTGAPRSATVQAVRDGELLELDADVFHALLHRDPGLAAAVARTLAVQLQASGGLSTASPRPAVISVRALGPTVAPIEFAAELAEALALFGSVETLAGQESQEGHAASLDRAERDHARVLLVDAGKDDGWGAFCSRQADRYVVLAAPGAEDASDVQAGADLVVVEPLPSSRLVALIESLEPRAHHHLESGVRGPSMSRVARRLVGRALGVVLSGGGARGYAHIGALGAMRESGLEIDRVGGCSIGAFIGALHASGLDPDEMRSRCREEFVRRSPFNDYTLPRVSLIRSRKAGRMLERVFGETLVEELPISLFTVSADLLASRTVVHRSGLLLEAVGASMSIPGLVPPLSRPGRLLVDGGVLNNLPVDVMAADDEGPIVAVDVIRRLDEMEDAVAPPLPTIMETLSRATVLGSVERAESNRRLADLLVTPDVQDVAMREFSALDRAADAGREAMRAALDSGGAEMIRARLAESG